AMRAHPASGSVKDVRFRSRGHVAAVSGGGENRQSLNIIPAFVTELVSFGLRIIEAFDHIPVSITGTLLILADIFKGKKIAASVIENAVDDHMNSALVALVNNIQKKFVSRCPLPFVGIAAVFVIN